MNVEEITIGEAWELVAMFGNQTKRKNHVGIYEERILLRLCK